MSADLHAFVTSKTASGLSIVTVAWYRANVARYLAWSEGKVIAKAETIEGYLAYLRETGKAPATISGCYRSLSVYFRWMVERRRLERSPLDNIPPPKMPVKRVQHIGIAHFRALCQSFPNAQWWQRRDQAILRVLFYCGLRANELLGLRLESIDRVRSVILVTEGKGGKDRDVPCAMEVVTYLDDYLSVRPAYPGEALFLSRNKSAYAPRGPLKHDGLKEMLRRRCKAANIPHFSPHKFRHAYAMIFANAGMPLSALAATMGHSSVNVTEKFYARWQTESLSAQYADAYAKITR